MVDIYAALAHAVWSCWYGLMASAPVSSAGVASSMIWICNRSGVGMWSCLPIFELPGAPVPHTSAGTRTAIGLLRILWCSRHYAEVCLLGI